LGNPVFVIRLTPGTVPVRDRLGLGQPTENPFFADIYVPSDVRLDDSLSLERDLRPVRVFLHGGFLQFGSTSGQHYNQQFFAAEHYGEVRVLLGHRYVAVFVAANVVVRGVKADIFYTAFRSLVSLGARHLSSRETLASRTAGSVCNGSGTTLHRLEVRF
jgi:hypothetical protein